MYNGKNISSSRGGLSPASGNRHEPAMVEFAGLAILFLSVASL